LLRPITLPPCHIAAGEFLSDNIFIVDSCDISRP
jgi:hypothetical protein